VYHQQEEAALQFEQEADFSSAVSTRDDTISGGGYVSPFQDIFDRMHENGPTSLGTTDEIVRFEREWEKNKKYLKCGIPEEVLRFTTTCYGRTLAAPHVMVNEHKVVVCVNTKYLPLDETEKEILREIVGKRLNDERNELRLQSNQFGSRIENKRHVVSMLDRIILACQRLGRELRGEAAETAAKTSAASEGMEEGETAMELRNVVEETSGSGDKIDGSTVKEEEVEYGAEQEFHDLMADAESIEIEEIPIDGETDVEPFEAAGESDGPNMDPSTPEEEEETMGAAQGEAASENVTAASAVPDASPQEEEKSVVEEMEFQGTIESPDATEQHIALESVAESVVDQVQGTTESSVESFELHSEHDATSEESASMTDEEQKSFSSQAQSLTTEAPAVSETGPVAVADDLSSTAEKTFVSTDIEEMAAAVDEQSEESQQVSMESSDSAASVVHETTDSNVENDTLQEAKDALDSEEKDSPESSAEDESTSQEAKIAEEDKGKKD
jgi:hypothetical protein